MLIADNTVAEFHYTLTNSRGEVLDSSVEEEPLSYLHGHENIIPGLERAMTGKQPGDRFQVTVTPEDAYGDRDEELVQVLPRRTFRGIDAIEPGMQFQARSEEGTQLITVTKVEGDQITVDGNHPLAGETLHFDVAVTSVRAATAEELEHGHAHEGEGHHH
jgi:FKBP-type peptidyl-prolyl cis-trans isomerase SlyD